MFRKLKLYIMLHLEARNLERAIGNSHFNDLKFAPSAIEGLISESRELHTSITRQWQRKLTDTLVNKAMLLATGIDDIITLSNSITLPAIRNALFKAYGARTSDLGNIITLLCNLNKKVDFDALGFEEANEVYSTAALLNTYGKKLAAETGPSLTLGVIGLLAEKIENFTRNVDDSRVAEDLVIGLAVAKLKGDPRRAVNFVEHFQLTPSHHRFLLAWLDENQLTSSIQAMRFTDAIITHRHYGSHVANRILWKVTEAGIDLNPIHRNKLEKLANPDKGLGDSSISNLIGRLIGTISLHSILERAFDDIFGEPEDGIISDGRNIFDDLESERDSHGLAGLGRILGMVHDMAEDHGFGPSNCATCPDLASCDKPEAAIARRMASSQAKEVVTIPRGPKEEMLRQLEEHLLAAHAENKLDQVLVDGMPALVFIMTHMDIFTPETRNILEAAVTPMAVLDM